MKCDELQERWFEAYPVEGDQIIPTKVYGKKDADDAIAELKDKLWISVGIIRPEWGKIVKVKFKDGSEDECRFSHDYKWVSKGMATCEATVDCYELMPENIQRLKKLPGVNILGEDFLKECNGKYQRIIANPPFSGNQDIEHVYKMFEFLTINGEMSVITSQHWKIAGDSKCKNFRKWIEEHNAQIQDIAAGEFKESGTGIQTSLIFIKKIRDDEIKRDKQASGQLDLFI